MEGNPDLVHASTGESKWAIAKKAVEEKTLAALTKEDFRRHASVFTKRSGAGTGTRFKNAARKAATKGGKMASVSPTDPATAGSDARPSNSGRKTLINATGSAAANFDQLMSRLVGRRGENTIHHQVAAAKIPFLAPPSSFRIRWDAVLVLLILWTSIMLPLQIAVIVDTTGPGWLVLDTLVDLFFIADLVLNFFTPYNAPNGEWITDRNAMAKNYAKSWFIVDLVSSVPIDVVMRWSLGVDDVADDTASGLRGGVSVEALKGAKLARLFKNLRLLRVTRLAKMMASSFGALSSAAQLVRILLAFIFFTHCFGCLFIFVSNNFYGRVEETWTWKAEINPVQMPDSGRTYVVASFNALSMLFGESPTPWQAAQTDAEMVTTICILLIGSIFHATLYGEVAHLMARFNSASSRRQEKLATIRQHLNSLRLDRVVCDRVMEYYDFMWQTNQFSNLDSFLQDLSPALQEEISLLISGPMVQKVPLFQTMKDACLVEIVKALRQRLYLGGDFIVCEGSIGREMFFVNSGSCEVVMKANMAIVLASFSTGGHFGEIALVTAGTRRTATVLATTNCNLSALYLDAFTALCSQFPELEKAVVEMAEERKKEEQALAGTVLATLGLIGKKKNKQAAQDKPAAKKPLSGFAAAAASAASAKAATVPTGADQDTKDGEKQEPTRVPAMMVGLAAAASSKHATTPDQAATNKRVLDEVRWNLRDEAPRCLLSLHGRNRAPSIYAACSSSLQCSGKVLTRCLALLCFSLWPSHDRLQLFAKKCDRFTPCSAG